MIWCDLEGLRSAVSEAKVYIPQPKLMTDNGTSEKAQGWTRQKPEANLFEILKKLME